MDSSQDDAGTWRDFAEQCQAYGVDEERHGFLGRLRTPSFGGVPRISKACSFCGPSRIDVEASFSKRRAHET